MRRPEKLRQVVVLSALIVAVLFGTVEAQRRFPVRGRPTTQGGGVETPPSNESISITSPPPPSSATSSDSQVIVGTATAGITAVTWANSTTGGSGTASLSGGVWTIEVPSSALVFEDTFTVTSSPTLVTHTPSTGSGWAEVVNTSAVYGYVFNSADDARVSATGATNSVMIYEAEPVSPLAGTVYDVSVATSSSFSNTSGSAAALVFGIVDADDYCVVDMINGSVIAAKVVSGTPTTLATITGGAAANQTYQVSRDGNDFVVYRNGISAATFTDAACAGSNRVGIGWGATRPSSGKAPSTAPRLDDFVLSNPGAAATGVPLNVGANSIVVTGTEADATPHTAAITVTRSGSDTTSPTLGITNPTPRPYSTVTAALTVNGTADDNIGVASVTVACATCTPTSVTATLANSGPTSVAWTADLTLASGANSITVTAADAAANSTVSAFTATLSAGADTTVPTVTITVPNSTGSNTVTTTPVTLGGTASDNVLVSSVAWSGDTCGGGTATGTTAWSTSVSFTVPTTCVVTVTATDSSGNTATDTHTFTYAPPLTITTVSPLQPAPEGSAYAGAQLAATGGTSPYTWDNNAGGSSLGGGACTGGSISSSGAITGTFTTAGSCTFTARVTDNVAATATKSFSILVGTVNLGGTNHTYFNTLCARSDTVKCESLRDNAKLTLGAAGNLLTRGSGMDRWSYDPANDVFATPQDAAKFELGAFDDTNPKVLSGNIDASTTSICINTAQGVPAYIENNFQFKIDNEVLTVTTAGSSQSVCPFTVTRGQFGTTAASHTSGALMYSPTNSVGKWVMIPTPTSPGNSYFYVIDFNMGWLGNQWGGGWKFLNWTDSRIGITYEPGIAGDATNGSKSFDCGRKSVTFNGATDNSVIYPPRFYSAPTYPLTKTDSPSGSCPADNAFVVKPNTWTRVFVQIQFRTQTTMNHTEDMTLSGNIDASATTLTVTGTFPNIGVFVVGRRVQIGSEIMTVVTAPTSNPGTSDGTTNPCPCTRTFTVTRGTDGTSAASHTSGDAVTISTDDVTMWMADETTDPVLIQGPLPHFFGNDRRSANFGIEQNASNARVIQTRADAGFITLTGYFRNFVLLGKSGAPDAAWQSLLVKPTVGGN